ncbi:MAG: hypothetical protein PVF85_08820 [Anaerolineales bacterium]
MIDKNTSNRELDYTFPDLELTLIGWRHILPRMDVLSSLVIGLSFLLAFAAVMRTIPHRRFLTFLFLLLPLAIFSYRWSLFRGARMEWVIGLIGAIILLAIWWLAWGRRLPPPDDSNIRVWTKDDPFE